MYKSYEFPKIKEMTTCKTNFVHVVGMKKGAIKLSVGPFLPITSSGDGNLPYNIDDRQGSTCDDFSKNFTVI